MRIEVTMVEELNPGARIKMKVELKHQHSWTADADHVGTQRSPASCTMMMPNKAETPAVVDS